MTQYVDRKGIYDYPFTKVVTGDTSYFSAHTFLFHGSDMVGVPASIFALCGIIDSGAFLDVRIYDVTNLQTIAEKTGITDFYPTVHDLGAISNVPAAQAVWEVQLLSENTPGPDGDVAVASLTMRH